VYRFIVWLANARIASVNKNSPTIMMRKLTAWGE
jgi:hypothetical protein